MRRILFAALAYLALAATAGWSHDAMDFYDRGLKSSLANKRIEYFSKAIELNPNLAKAAVSCISFCALRFATHNPHS